MSQVEMKRNSTSSDVEHIEQLLSQKNLKPVNKSKVGFSKVADQIFHKYSKKTTKVNLMILGGRGLGKSSLVNNLFRTSFPLTHKPTTDDIVEDKFFLEENDVKLQLKIVRYPQYSTRIDNSDCCKVVDDYLTLCFQRQFDLEHKLDTSSGSNDFLVHVCLYFVQPQNESHCLSPLDLRLLETIHNKVNVVPLIAKADGYTDVEKCLHKENLTRELTGHGINCYPFPVPQDSGWRPLGAPLRVPDRRSIVASLAERVPFSVVAGNEFISRDGKQIPVRSYHWGQVEVDDLNHCDTAALRTLLLSTHLQSLVDVSHQQHYGSYLSQLLAGICAKLGAPATNADHPALYLQILRVNWSSMFNKKLSESNEGFEQLVCRKEKELTEKRVLVEQQTAQMAGELEILERDLDSLFQKFVAERSHFQEISETGSIDYLDDGASTATGTLRKLHNPFKTLTRFRRQAQP